MPWLGGLFPLGDTSPLTRLTAGHDEALRRFLAPADRRFADDAAGPRLDPWAEDLFHRHPVPPAAPAAVPERGDADDGDSVRAAGRGSRAWGDENAPPADGRPPAGLVAACVALVAERLDRRRRPVR